MTENAASSGSKIYIPEYDKSTNFTVNILNDIGTGSCYVAVTASNLPPDIYTIVYTGSEDDIQINTTLSGTDPNPGDSVFFE